MALSTNNPLPRWLVAFKGKSHKDQLWRFIPRYNVTIRKLEILQAGERGVVKRGFELVRPEKFQKREMWEKAVNAGLKEAYEKDKVEDNVREAFERVLEDCKEELGMERIGVSAGAKVMQWVAVFNSPVGQDAFVLRCMWERDVDECARNAVSS